MPLVASLLDEAGVVPRELRRIVCGGGPGSFTSLRIAASIAKGIATAAGCELWAMSSLALIAAHGSLGEGRYLAALDAMRGESYAQLFGRDAAGVVRELGVRERVASAELDELAVRLAARTAGPGLATGVSPRAQDVGRLLTGGLAWPVELASWEPDYGRLAEAQVKWEATHGRPLLGS